MTKDNYHAKGLLLRYRSLALLGLLGNFKDLFLFIIKACAWPKFKHILGGLRQKKN